MSAIVQSATHSRWPLTHPIEQVFDTQAGNASGASTVAHKNKASGIPGLCRMLPCPYVRTYYHGIKGRVITPLLRDRIVTRA